MEETLLNPTNQDVRMATNNPQANVNQANGNQVNANQPTQFTPKNVNNSNTNTINPITIPIQIQPQVSGNIRS